VKHAFDIPRIVIAGASSNVGKTTITAGLIVALRQKGLTVQPFKCGPDYVDPSYHERAAGRPCRNLDTWMLSDSQLLESFARACQDADIAVVEGVMGLYDGSDWHDERGSTAQIAKLLNAPVLLVFDISGSARSAAAGVLGYQTFDPAVAIRGVVLNFAGSEGHALGCAGAIQNATSLAMVGWLPREMRLQIPERHLGLVPGGEQIDSDALIAQMSAAVTARFDIDGIASMARAAVARAGAPAARVGAPTAGAEAASTRADRGASGDVAAPRVAAEWASGSQAAATPMLHESRATSAEQPAPLGAQAALGVGGRSSPAGSHGEAAQLPSISDSDSSATSAAQLLSASDGDVCRAGGASTTALRRPILAVARDEAFCFYYPENLELLAEEGAEVEFFSPLRGERPSPQAAGVYLGGGYPELHGEALASNTALWQALKDMHAADKPIYAECGGFMVLTQGLTDASGHTWKMAGLLPGVTRMSGRLAALGYRHVTALRPNLLVDPNESLRGHEFRYSSWVADSSAAAALNPQAALNPAAALNPTAALNLTAAWNPTPAWEVKGTRGKVPEDGVGYARGNLLASYLHVHFGQRRDLARRFVARLL
jgi:cobyrinic acid a,c-diamide synthase